MCELISNSSGSSRRGSWPRSLIHGFIAVDLSVKLKRHGACLPAADLRPPVLVEYSRSLITKASPPLHGAPTVRRSVETAPAATWAVSPSWRPPRPPSQSELKIYFSVELCDAINIITQCPVRTGDWVIRPGKFITLIVHVMPSVLPILPIFSDNQHLFIDKG